MEKVKNMSIFGKNDTLSILVYHGSDRVVKVEDIKFPGPRNDCDFGQGFYLTDQRKIAEEWVFDESTPIINEYRLTVSKDKILYLKGTEWLRIVLGFRTKRFKINIKSPIIHGLIADDRMSSVIPPFLVGTLGDKRLIECLDYCNLGNQYCLRKSAEGISWERSYPLKGIELQRAGERFTNRRKGMTQKILEIQRKPIEGERFIEDYLRDGDYFEI